MWGNIGVIIIIIMAHYGLFRLLKYGLQKDNHILTVLFDKVSGIINKIEESKGTLGLYIAFLVSIMLIRSFLEIVIGREKLLEFGELIIHYNLFYLAVLLGLLIMVKLFAKEQLDKVFKVILPFFSVIILPPLIDLIVMGPDNFQCRYIAATEPTIAANFYHVIRYFVDLPIFQRSVSCGVTLGMRFEVWLVMMGTAIYVFLKTRKAWKATASGVLAWFIALVSGTVPLGTMAMTELAKRIGFINTDKLTSTMFWLLIIIVQIPIVLYLWDRRKLKGVFVNFRLCRIFLYLGMFWLGIYLRALGDLSAILEVDFYRLIMVNLSIIFSCGFAVTINDITDIEIDKVSGKERPLVSKEMTKRDMVWTAVIYFFLAIISAAQFTSKFTFIVFAFMALYWVYSMPPVRLKRVPLFATIILALVAVVALYGGALFIGYERDIFFSEKAMNLVHKFAFAIFVVFSLAFNAKDLKDFEGDTAGEIPTLMTILGAHKGRWVIGVLVWLSYCLFPVILGVYNFPIIALSVALGALSFYFIIKKSGEKLLFITYFGYYIIFLTLIRSLQVPIT